LLVANLCTSVVNPAAVSGGSTEFSASCSVTNFTHHGVKRELNHGSLWICIGKYALLNSEKECLLTTGHSLNDKHINAAHALLKNQFTNAVGLAAVQSVDSKNDGGLADHKLQWLLLCYCQ